MQHYEFFQPSSKPKNIIINIHIRPDCVYIRLSIGYYYYYWPFHSFSRAFSSHVLPGAGRGTNLLCGQKAGDVLQAATSGLTDPPLVGGAGGGVRTSPYQ